MVAISSPGIGSGLDINGLIGALMAAERLPLGVMNTRKEELGTDLSAYGRLKGAISDFQSAMTGLGSTDKFSINAANSSNDGVFTVGASSTAAPGSYSIDFSNNGTNQLAQVHKLTSLDFADTSSSIAATGTLRIDLGGNSFDVVIDASNDSLDGIKNAINSAADNTGVTATVITVDSGSRLLLSSDKTGAANSVTLSDVSGSVAATLGTTTVTAAQDAIFMLDGNQVTSTSNTVTGVIEGVTIELNALGATGTTETLSVSRDTSAVKENVQTFVDAYNDLRGMIGYLSKGDLQGDNTLLSIQSQMRNILNTAPTGLGTSLQFLSEVGIKTSRTGDLELDSTLLNEKLAEDFNGVAELFANDNQGYAFRLEALADEQLAIDGIIDTREDGINARIGRIDTQIENFEYRMTLTEARYRAQFTALDGLLSSMQSTSNFLAQQLGSLPGAFSG
ncbi:MAG TPA: flagellar cap protein [Chromatiales bacterium]|nr:flagellar cap protein [Chromatiales bacterium]HEX22494.1 flagellar cap protein [Chromatiales bacterium]